MARKPESIRLEDLVPLFVGAFRWGKRVDNTYTNGYPDEATRNRVNNRAKFLTYYNALPLIGSIIGYGFTLIK